MFNTKIRLLLIVFMLLSPILAYPTPAWACSCAIPDSPEEAFSRADAVFVGRATGDGNTFWNRLQVDFIIFYHQFVPPLPHTLVTGLYERSISFEVQDSWQGVETTLITMRTGWGGGDCGYNFQQGKQYLVYASHSPDGDLYASICLRTAALENAGEDLEYLRTVPKLELTDSPLMFNARILYLAIALLGTIVLAVAIWWRRKPAKNRNR